MKKQITVLIFMMIIVTQLKAQWIQTNGPHGGKSKNIESFLVDGSNIFAGTKGDGVYLSTNNGASWTSASSGISGAYVWALAGSSPNLFAGTSNGVFRSTNNGGYWFAVNHGLQDYFGKTPEIAALASGGTNLYAGTYSYGVFLSTNNGASWTPTEGGTSTSPLSNLNALVVSGTNLFAGTSYDGVFRSTDSGKNWTQVNNGLSKTYINTLAVYGNSILAGTEGDGIYRSDDNGSNWYAANIGLPGKSTVNSIVINGTNIYAGTFINSVYLSTNGGMNWTSLNNGMIRTSITSIAVSDTNLIVGNFTFGDDGLLYRSTNNGASWIDVSLKDDYINSLVAGGTNLFAGTSINGVYLSTDKGENWTKVNSGLPNTVINTLFIDGTSLYAGTNDGVFRSTDNGSDWNAINNGLPSRSGITALAKNGKNMFAGIKGGGVYLSTDNGGDWITVNDGFDYGSEVRSFVISDNSIFAGTKGGIYISTNNGGNWKKLDNKLITSVNALAISDKYLFALSDGVCYYSTDSGVNWTSATSWLKNTFVTSLAVIGNNIFIGTYSGGVYVSTDKGISWRLTGLEKTEISAFTAIDNYIFAGTFNGGGVWKRPVSEMTSGINREIADPPLCFILSQNYPNPFNPVTTIKYTLPQSDFVRLIVYDILGNEIAILVNEEQSAGSFSTKFDGSNLVSGVYLYQLQAGNYRETKKLLLVK